MGVFLNMIEKQEKSSESTKDKEKEEAAAYFAKRLAGINSFDTPFYYLWSEFLGGLAVISFKFWIMYLTNEEGFREGLEDEPKAIIDAILQMWRLKTTAEIDQELEKQKKMMKSPYGKIFGKMVPAPEESYQEMLKTISQVEEKARKVLYDGIIKEEESQKES